MLIVKWLPTAAEDLEAIIDYIAQFNTVAAYDLEDHILKSAESLAEHPYKGRDGRKAGTRELLVHPNYWLVYEVSDSIKIANVLHTRKLYP
ncbi:type II toxin-antitoxin system RelE/ParE family toxin [Salmonella enterica subsp. enterica]|jgi:addiction module RelE/StbE family toxin|nr:type II toxin-antitoxin system RelE/ParE family toxin [Salmonella enterica subsp. enterica]